MGCIGALIIAIASFFMGISFSIPRSISFSSYPWWLIHLSIIISIGMIIIAFGFYGFYRNYGTTMGLITSISLIIGSFWLPFFIFNSIRDRSGWEMPPFDLIIVFSGAIYTLGICLILMGAVLLNVKNLTGVRILTKTAGAACIGSSLLYFAITPVHVGGIAWYAFSSSSIIMALMFFSARPYTENEGNDTNIISAFIQ
jgi:predicted permease